MNYTYHYLGGQLRYETRGAEKFYYFYDANGVISGFRHVNSSGTATLYYTLTNAQGDVIAIYDQNGALVGSYEYDAWGKVLKMTDGSGNVVAETDTTEIVSINAIRYRGYYYDKETKLYYLQSRYYNPDVGRFLNADGYVTTGQGVLSYNMFAYCGNNPVNYSDPSGHSWILVLSVVVIIGFTVAGGIFGACADEPLAEKSREAKKEEFEEKMPSKDKVPNTVPDYVPKGNSKQNTTTETTEETKLSTKDRLNNIVIGASIGLAIGGSVVMLAAMPLTPILGLGITAKLMAIGMLAFNIEAIVFAPFYSVDLEPIEWDEQ